MADVIAPGTPWRRDPDELREGLGGWVRRTLGEERTVSGIVAPEGTGMSSETVLFDVARPGEPASERYVARVAPLPSLHPVFPAYDLDLQRRCMDLVRRHTTVPTPEVPWYEPDQSWLGAPFLVMGRVEGRTPSDMPPYVFGGWLMDAPVEEQSRLEHNAVSVLVRIHELTPATADLSFLARPEHGASALDQHLGYQHWYYEWAREGLSYPLIERGLAWLADHRPPEGPTVLNWGDSRIGNVLWDGAEPVAVLDWEMAALGPAEVDIAWMLFLHRFFQGMAESYAMPGMPSFMQHDAVCATYERLSGHRVAHLEWFEVLAAVRFAVISVRTTARSIAYGQTAQPEDPDDLIMFRPLLEAMLA